jgi:hypothetical protein
MSPDMALKVHRMPPDASYPGTQLASQRHRWRSGERTKASING